jgi:D-serine dehydratase
LDEDLPLPAAVIRTSALHHNSEWMQRFAENAQARLAPHGKTTMCPALFDLQLRDGAWALTVATPQQLHVVRSFGYQRIVLANQLIGKSAIEWVIDELKQCPDFEFYCLVDSAENLEQLVQTARRKHLSRPLRILLEMGVTGGRTGCRSVKQAMDLARLVAECRDVIALHGIEGYEGIIRGSTYETTIEQVDAFLDTIVECANRCARENLFAEGEVLLSAGGSAYFDRVSNKLREANLNRPAVVLLRGGCYLTHDSVLYAGLFEKLQARSTEAAHDNPGLLPALEIWAYVQSMPEPGLAIVSMGKRDISFDELPIPVKWCRPGPGARTVASVGAGHSVSRLNDQHCYVSVPAECIWRVGDMVGFGISHPCLTFDKWRFLHLVDDNYRVTGSVKTYF